MEAKFMKAYKNTNSYVLAEIVKALKIVGVDEIPISNDTIENEDLAFIVVYKMAESEKENEFYDAITGKENSIESLSIDDRVEVVFDFLSKSSRAMKSLTKQLVSASKRLETIIQGKFKEKMDEEIENTIGAITKSNTPS